MGVESWPISERSSTFGDLQVRAVIEEFGRILEVFGTQLEVAVREADRQSATVGTAFHQIDGARQQLAKIAAADESATLLRATADTLGGALNEAVTGLQHQDRLTQRVGHIRDALLRLQGLLRDGIQRSTTQWLVILRHVEELNEVEQSRLLSRESISNGSIEIF